MGKSVHDDILDAALNYIAANADRISVCETEPTTYAEATTNLGAGGYKLAMSITPTFTGPLNGDISGRKLTVDAEALIPIVAAGNAQHIALCDSVTSKLLFVTTCTLQALVAGGFVTIPAWDIEIADPA